MTPNQINEICKETLIEHLGIEILEVLDLKVVARMPVDKRTIQPMKRLHGGATMALAETVGSIGSLNLIDPEKFQVLGTEISGSHVGSTTSDEVIATGVLLHKGVTSHVWEIVVKDTNGVLISICRFTCRILPVQKL